MEEHNEHDYFEEMLETCYECRGLGDDYYFDDSGELVCACTECPFNDWSYDDD